MSARTLCGPAVITAGANVEGDPFHFRHRAFAMLSGRTGQANVLEAATVDGAVIGLTFHRRAAGDMHAMGEGHLVVVVLIVMHFRMALGSALAVMFLDHVRHFLTRLVPFGAALAKADVSRHFVIGLTPFFTMRHHPLLGKERRFLCTFVLRNPNRDARFDEPRHLADLMTTTLIAVRRIRRDPALLASQQERKRRHQ